MTTKIGKPDQARFNFIRNAFATRLDLSREALFQSLARDLSPKWFQWTQGTMKVVDTLCRYRWISARTCQWNDLIGFACVWWLSDPARSSVVICSGSKRLLLTKWKTVRKFHKSINGYGAIKNSEWTLKKGDRFGIFGATSSEDIRGIHTKRQMVIVFGKVSYPVWNSAKSLWKYPVDSGGEFIFVSVGGDKSLHAQPDGKMSITI
jgi:hypothetical protein